MGLTFGIIFVLYVYLDPTNPWFLTLKINDEKIQL